MKTPFILLASITALLPFVGRAQTITVFNNRAAFEAAMGNFKVVDDFSFGGSFLNVTTNNGTINAAAKWADIARDPEPSTIWATPFGSTAFGGTWDNTVAGVGGGLAFDLDFGAGNIVTVPGSVAGNAPANTFFGFIADQAFFNVRERQFDSAGGTLQETHTLDDLTVRVTADWQDVRFTQGGTGAWDTAGHWDITAVPGVNQRAFVTPAGGAVVNGPAAAASVRQLAIGDGTTASRLNLTAAGPLTVARGAVVRTNSTLGGAGRLLGTLATTTGSTLTVADGQTLQVGAAAANGVSIAGTITVGTGSLALEDTGATPLGPLTTLGGGTLTTLGGMAQIGSGDTLRGHGSLTGAFELQTGGTLRAENGTLQVAQLSALDGTVVVDAARTLGIGGTNAVAFGTTTVGAGGTLNAGGILQLIASSTFGAGAVVRGGLGLQLSGTVSHTGAQTFDAGTGDLLINNISFTPNTTDTLLGARLVMTGSSATLTFSNDASLGTAGNQIVLNGGRLFPQGSVTLPPARSIETTALNGSVIALAGTNFAFEGNITGAGRLASTGSSGGVLGGTVRLTGNNTHTGGTDVAGAILEVASDAALGAPNGVLLIGRENGLTDIPGKLRALGNLDIPATRTTTFRLATVDTNGFNVTFNQPVTGQDLTKQGAGILRFNTANTFNSGVNDIVVEGGTVRLGVNEALGRPRVTLFDTTLDLNGFTQTVSTFNGTGTVQLGSGGALTFIGGSSVEAIISGAGSLNFGQAPFAADSYRLLGENTFTGSVTITRGNRVAVKTTAAFGAAGNPLLLDNGGIETDFTAQEPVVIGTAFPLTIGAGGASFGANGQPLIIEAQLTGNTPIRVRGGGATSEVRFAHPANTFVSSLQIGEASGSNAVLGIVADGSLGAAGNVVRLGDRFFDGESTRTARGTLRAFADLTLPVTRSILLNGTASGGGGEIDTNGFRVVIEGAIGEVQPGVSLTKSGDGPLALNGVSLYTGETRVAAGALGGIGTLGAVRVQSAATLAPGNPVGALHTGSVSFANGSSFALAFASPASASGLEVTGSVTLDGDVQLALTLSYAVTGPDTFTAVLNDGPDPVSGVFALGAETLEEGETFFTSGAAWTISYVGGSGNDITLTVVPEPSIAPCLLGGLGMLLGLRRRTNTGR